jgi:hypothetical protein
MKPLKPMLVFLLLLLCAYTSHAVIINGGKGLPHTKAAWVSQTGRLTLLTNTRFWGKVYQSRDVLLNVPTAQTIWDVQSLISVNYGLGSHFDLNVTPILYQDDQTKNGVYPYDTFVGLKVGSYGSKAGSLNYGMQLHARFPTGEVKNVIFEDYTAGTVEFGLTGLVSYASDPLYPEDAFNMHLNLGYNNSNDVGEIITANTFDPFSRVLSQTQQVNYAIGLWIPTESFDYGLEWHGNAWLQQPPQAAAGREDYLFMNAIIKYKPYRWFNFLLSGEYRLTGDREETVGLKQVPAGLPNYNTWRINVGAQFTLLPTSVYRTSERDVLMQKAESRRELFEQIIKERRETESAEEELERIRDERRKAERELERLRKILESQTNQRQQVEDMRKELEPKK